MGTKITKSFDVNKQTNNIYINKKTKVKARFNSNSIKNFINVKMTFKNIFHNLIYIDFTIFCLQMSIEIDNVYKKEKNQYKQTKETIIVGFNINFLIIWVLKGRAWSVLNFQYEII